MRIAVTGLGLVTPFGIGKELAWEQICDGRSGVTVVDRFVTDNLPVRFAATINAYDAMTHGHPALLNARIALDVAMEAIEEAEIDFSAGWPGRVFLASTPLEPRFSERVSLCPPEVNEVLDVEKALADPYRSFELYNNSYVPRELMRVFRPTEWPVMTNTACASGGTAIALAVEAIESGQTDLALVIGCHAAVSPEEIARFSLLHALSRRNDHPESASRPFAADRDGFVLGEGAGAMVLERADRATARGAKIQAYLTGVGESGDSYHRTRSHPTGRPIVECMAAAIHAAELLPDDIDYVNAHGTGTIENDRMEYLSLRTLFQDKLMNMPVSSTKSSFGHTLSAAGVIEGVISILAIRDQRLPPTINCTPRDPHLPLDVVPGKARSGNVRNVLSNSFGFGGQNVCIVLSAA